MNSGGVGGAMAGRVDPDEAGELAFNDDLGARFLSAAVLAPAAVAAAIAGGPWLAGATGAAIVAMAYEWARMSEPRAIGPAWSSDQLSGKIPRRLTKP